MGRTACTEPQCLYKGALYFYLLTYRPLSRVPEENSESLSLETFQFHYRSFNYNCELSY